MTAVTVTVLAAAVVVGLVQAGALARPPDLSGARSRVRGLDPVLVAAAVGGLLRLGWVTVATRTPTELRDPAEYLRIAGDLGHGILPRFAGIDHSAYWPPGYPAVLSPFVAVADRTGWLSPAYAASLVNVAAGTILVVLTARLARRWFGPRPAVVAAWAIALCPALVYWTATAHTESVFAPVLVGLVLLCGWAAERGGARPWLLTGVAVGAAFLIRSPALVLVPVPALTLRATTGSWAGAVRATGLLLVGAVVVLAPWAVRNGVQVGHWSPASTNNAAAACFGHNDGARPTWEDSLADPELQLRCFRSSPFDDPRAIALLEGGRDAAELPDGLELTRPDEARWYQETMGDAVRWAVTHPVEEVSLSVRKVWHTWSDEGRVVDGARNYAEPGWAGAWQRPLGVLANLWTWVVGGLAIAAMVRRPATRRATPVWVPVVAYTVMIVGGVAEPHYRYPVVPLVAVLAASWWASTSSRVPAPERATASMT